MGLDGDGFLAPPSESWFFRKNDIVPFEEIAASPCLVLLGEPGIGKTFALEKARESAQGQRRSVQVLFRNLGAYGDEQRLVKDVFESNQFETWLSKGGELHVFLDSFDECLVRVDALTALLADRINRIPNAEGLFFRIVSRTAEWKAGLEEALKHRWGEEGVRVTSSRRVEQGQQILGLSFPEPRNQSPVHDYQAPAANGSAAADSPKL